MPRYLASAPMTRSRRHFLRIAAGTLAAVPLLPALAHHSFSAMYDAKKPIRLQGKLLTLRWTNPHAWFELEVTGKDGQTTVWRCEGAAPGLLSQRGLSKTDIKPGDRIIVDGYLARSGARIVDARRITLADGRQIDGGSTNDGGPQASTGR